MKRRGEREEGGREARGEGGREESVKGREFLRGWGGRG
jgi:hypothetical protein